MTGFVYVLKLTNGKYYLGSTNNLERRMYEHKSGTVCSTRKHIPCELVFYREYTTVQEARHVEWKIKSYKKAHAIYDFINGSLII